MSMDLPPCQLCGETATGYHRKDDGDILFACDTHKNWKPGQETKAVPYWAQPASLQRIEGVDAEIAACKGCGQDVAMSRNTLDENGLFCMRCRVGGQHTAVRDMEYWRAKRRAYLERELAELDQEGALG